MRVDPVSEGSSDFGLQMTCRHLPAKIQTGMLQGELYTSRRKLGLHEVMEEVDFTFCVSSPMDEKDALMRATSFSARYGKRVVMVLSARLLWQYDSAASTAAFGTLQA